MRRREFAKGVLAFCITPLWRYPFESSGQKSGEAVLTAVGDVCLGYDGKHIEPILENLAEEEAFRYPFEKVMEHFEGIVFCNLEGTLTLNDKKVPKRFNFRANPKYANCLRDFGIVSLANNHTMDFGEEGLEETIATLDSFKIKHVGAGSSLFESRMPVYISKGGISAGFLAYSIVCSDYVPQGYRRGFVSGCENIKDLYSDVRADISKVKEKADICAVSFHWGKEGSHYPVAEQKSLARACIDSGADIILGHHPHVLQGIERYKNGLIFYSLGNFMFSGNRDPKDKDSIMAKIKMCRTGVKDYEIIPVKITSAEHSYQPYVLEGAERERVLKRVGEYSKNL